MPSSKAMPINPKGAGIEASGRLFQTKNLYNDFPYSHMILVGAAELDVEILGLATSMANSSSHH